MRERFLTLIIIMFIIALNAFGIKKECVEKKEIRRIIKYLASDKLEGRAPGTGGDQLAQKFIVKYFKANSIIPYLKSGYIQNFELNGYKTKRALLTISNKKLNYMKDFVGTYTGKNDKYVIEGNLLFAGFGIYNKKWNWDDYKDIDVKEKILLIRVNDPGMFIEDIFEGKTLTYYGRWIYKLEEASKRGAKGVLLIHTDKSAGYGWKVVKNSWSGEELYLSTDMKDNPLKFRGWVKESSLERILSDNKINLNLLYEKSLKRDFKPINLNLKVKVKGINASRIINTANVVGLIKGKSDKSIVMSAHIDHLGKDSNKKGDNIFNGAIDNSSAVASMLITAKRLKRFEKYLFYNIIVLACNAEESGLLGSRYFVENTDRKKIIANINFESTPVWEKTRDFIGIGARFSEIKDLMLKVLKKYNLIYREFSMSNQGFFYRSDQFSFARYDIPGIWITAGEEYISGKNRLLNFFKTNYHTVNDEYDDNWKLDSTIQTINVAYDLIKLINSSKKKPLWKNNITFPIKK